jgi:imidazolonepropionase
MSRASLLVVHAAELVTLAGPPGPRAGTAQGDAPAIADGAVAVGADGRIVAVGPTTAVLSQVDRDPDTLVLDARGRAVLPGFVDPHTHAVFAGDRVREFEALLSGVDYLDLLARGCGILHTMRVTSAASEDELLCRATAVLDHMLAAGTTTVEIKTGYGSAPEDELKLLRVIGRLAAARPQVVVGTLLAAHAVPSEYRDDTEGYVDLVCRTTIPEAAALGIARFCDVFCEAGVFSVDQARRILITGRRHGLVPKIHAEQRHRTGGARLAAEVGAISADHLEHVAEGDLVALRAAGTVAVLLPGAAFMLREQRLPPARRMIEHGIPIALGTDFNPGSSPVWSMPVIIGLACVLLGLTPAEALVAATVNAAHAVGVGDRVGSIEPGKRADLLILDAPSYRYIPYYFGAPLVDTVIAGGRVVVREGRVVR